MEFERTMCQVNCPCSLFDMQVPKETVRALACLKHSHLRALFFVCSRLFLTRPSQRSTSSVGHLSHRRLCIKNSACFILFNLHLNKFCQHNSRCLSDWTQNLWMLVPTTSMCLNAGRYLSKTFPACARTSPRLNQSSCMLKTPDTQR
jgi:hypothetical protein